MTLQAWLIIPISYALSCFATGYYLVRWRTGQDLRTLGTGATGGRNVSRVLGKTGFVITAIGDILKAAVALGLARYWQVDPVLAAFCIPAAAAGHNWPMQLGFKGGKGLSAIMGATLVFDWRIALIQLALAALSSAATRRVTLSFMAAVALTPVTAGLLGHGPFVIAAIALAAILILIAHRENIATAVRDLRQPAGR